MEWFGRICGLLLICCGLLVVCAQICGLTVRFLGGGCLFSLPDLVFEVVGGGLVVYARVAVGGFCSFGVAGGGLHFHVFCHSKDLKLFYNKIFNL